MRRTVAIALLVLCMASMVGSTATAAAAKMPAGDFRAAFRKLWEDHIIWTRMYIVSAFANLGDQNQVAARLLRNQTDIGNAIKPYYGNAAGDKLTSLLKQHIVISTEIVAAMKARDKAKLANADKRWHTNADSLAAFLSSANPNISKRTMTNMLYSHLSLTTQEATARFNKNYPADIAAFDKVHNEILGMSDYIANGVIKQFPSRFTK